MATFPVNLNAASRADLLALQLKYLGEKRVDAFIMERDRLGGFTKENIVYYHEYGYWKPHLESGTLTVDDDDQGHGDPNDPSTDPKVGMDRGNAMTMTENREHAPRDQTVDASKLDALQNTLNTMNETLILLLTEVKAGNKRNNQVEEGAVGGVPVQIQTKVASPGWMPNGLQANQDVMRTFNPTRSKIASASTSHPALYPFSSYPPPQESGWNGGLPQGNLKLEAKGQEAAYHRDQSSFQDVRQVRRPNLCQVNVCPQRPNDGARDDFGGERGQRMRQMDPPSRKLPKFDGKPDSVVDWTAFIVQFERLALRHNWDVVECLDNLIDCLRDHALLFYSRLPVHVRDDYRELRDRLAARFSTMDDAPAARRKLQEAKQLPEEPLEEYAARVQQLVNIGYPETALVTIQALTVDAFLKGCRDKNTAFLTLNSNPATIDEALRRMISTSTNHKVMFGTSSVSKIRQVVRFEESQDPPHPAVRAVQIGDEQWNSVGKRCSTIEGDVADLKQDMKQMKSSLVELTKMLQRRSDAARRSRSPSPKGGDRCFNCQEIGHFSRECPRKAKGPRRSRSPSPAAELNF